MRLGGWRGCGLEVGAGMRIIGALLGMAMAAGMIPPALAQKQKNAPPVTLKPAGAWVIAANRIEIDAGKPLRVGLEPGRTAAAFKALGPCHADLLKSWNLDPEILRTAVNRAAPTGWPQRWVTNADYPQQALHRREQGTTTFRVMIGADGKVFDCGILYSSGSKELDNTSCAVMRKRGEFTPARDAGGNPVPDLWVSRFRWELPGY